MAIYKVRHYSNFTQISNNIIRNRELSDGAFRAFAVLLSHSEDWKFSIKSYAHEMDIGEGRASRYIHELMDAGHIEEIQDRNEKGQFVHGYNFYETPRVKDDKPNTSEPEEKKPPVKKGSKHHPSVDNPRPENPSVDNASGFSLYNNKKRVTKTDLQRESEKTAHAEKQEFGKYKNVLLTPEEYGRLVETYGKDQTDRSIEGMSDYMQIHNKSYPNVFARLDLWIRQDIEKAKQSPVPCQSKESSQKSDSDFDVSMYKIFTNNFDLMDLEREEERKRHEEEEKRRAEEKKQNVTLTLRN